MILMDIDEIDLENFYQAVITREWKKVVKMYKEKKELRTANISYLGKKGTAIHWAIGWEKEHVVESMVDIVMNDDHQDNNGDDKNLVLEAQDDNGNTPLHIAARNGSVRICNNIRKANPLLLIAKRNKAGETPLFLAVLYGKKEAFLSLHFQYMSSLHCQTQQRWGDIAQCIRRENKDTILHCALEYEHIDLAMKIVLLYKDYLPEITCMCNRNGLSPLHLLAETPSFFQSTDLAEQSFVVKTLLYPLTRFVRVRDELEHDANKKCLRNLVDSIRDFFVVVHPHDWWSWTVYIVVKIARFLFYLLVMIPLGLPLIAEYWFHKMRNMKKKHTWSIQILKSLLQHASDEYMSANPYKEEEDNEAGGSKSKIIDTPLMVATKNGVTEVVDNILEYFPCTTKIVNEEGKNTVLLAAEMRQTKVYKMLYKILIESDFSQVDKKGNTALHLVAKPTVNLNWQATTMIEEFKWFEYVKKTMPDDLLGKYNHEKETAEEIFKKSFKDHIESDKQWLNQTSQTSSVASTVVASMAFSSIVTNNNGVNYSTILALSLSLASTICFLAILAFRSQSINFWRYAPFMLQLGIFSMFGSIVALWISLMLNGKALVAYSILGWPIAIFTIVSLPIFIRPTLISMFSEVPPPVHNVTRARANRYRKE